MTIEDEIARALRDFLQPEGFEVAESDRIFAQRLSPLLNRVRAEALREAAESSQAKMFSPAVYVGPRRLKLGIGAKEWLNDCADRIEQNSEGNGA